MATLLNRTEVRRRVLVLCEENRPYNKFGRVSSTYLDWFEGRVMAMLKADVHSHPSTGRTFGGALVPKESR